MSETRDERRRAMTAKLVAQTSSPRVDSTSPQHVSASEHARLSEELAARTALAEQQALDVAELKARVEALQVRCHGL